MYWGLSSPNFLCQQLFKGRQMRMVNQKESIQEKKLKTRRRPQTRGTFPGTKKICTNLENTDENASTSGDATKNAPPQESPKAEAIKIFEECCSSKGIKPFNFTLNVVKKDGKSVGVQYSTIFELKSYSSDVLRTPSAAKIDLCLKLLKEVKEPEVSKFA